MANSGNGWSKSGVLATWAAVLLLMAGIAIAAATRSHNAIESKVDANTVNIQALAISVAELVVEIRITNQARKREIDRAAEGG